MLLAPDKGSGGMCYTVNRGDLIMSTKPMSTNLVKLLKPHKGEWVTLSHDEKKVLGHGESIDAALAGAKKAGEHHPLLMRVPDKHGFVLI